MAEDRESVGDAILDLVASARHEVLLVAPFVKQATLRRILEVVPADVPVCCITRWEPKEIVAGVSDLQVWDLVEERANTTLRVRMRLHAKLYQADERVLVGSANLTDTALGWSQVPNLELLLLLDSRNDDIELFKQELMSSSVAVSQTLYESVKRAVDALGQTAVALSSFDALAEAGQMDVQSAIENWLPSCRSPDRLFDAYRGRDDRMLTSAFMDAQHDIAALNLPVGLDRQGFEAYVAAVLQQVPLVQDIDGFAATPRSRDDMSDFLVSRMGRQTDAAAASEAWDTLKLWLLTFFPDRYRLKPPEGTEVFVRGRRLA